MPRASNYQYQSFKLGSTTPEINDNIGISSFMIPLEVGANLDAKVLAVQLGVAGTVAFNSSVSDNAFGANKDDTNNTRWGWMLNAGARDPDAAAEPAVPGGLHQHVQG